MTTATPNIAYRAAASSMTIRFGSATVNGRLIPTRTEDRTPKVSYRTPDGKNVHQVYQDEDGKVWDRDDLGRVIQESKGVYRSVEAEVLQAAKVSSLPQNAVSFSAYSPKEVAGHSVSDGRVYVFDTQLKDSKGKPTKLDGVNEQWCDFLYSIVDKGDVELVEMANISRNSEAPYRLVIHQGNLALEKLAFPSDLREFQPRKVEISAADKKKSYVAAKSVVKNFDPEALPNTELINLLALKDGTFKAPKSEEAPAEASKMDLAAALDGFEA